MKIVVAGAGGAPSEGVIRSLLECQKREDILGIGSEPTDLVLSAAKRKYHVPYANDQRYKSRLLEILSKERPDFIHFQNDLEIFEASKIRGEIEAMGVTTYLPSHDVIDKCVHKFKTYQVLEKTSIKVPKTYLIKDEEVLKMAFRDLGNEHGTIWLRSCAIGGGGKGAAPTNDFEFARAWIKRYQGWGNFTASELLTNESVTSLSIWHQGSLVVSQGRLRKGWTHGNRSVSGVTGVTKVGQTISDPVVDDISIRTIKAIDAKPHGIYGVDLTYDSQGVPNPTEINISRFFTTILFFTRAGLNMPKIFKDIALYNEFPDLENKQNPLPNGLLWLRGMDTSPRLLRAEDIQREIL